MKFLFLLAAFILTFSCWGQTDADALEKQVKGKSGFEKLATLNQLSAFFNGNNDRKFRKYAKQGCVLAENFDESKMSLSSEQSNMIAEAFNHFAVSQYDKKHYLDARNIFQKAETLSEDIGNEAVATNAKIYLAKIDSLADDAVKDNIFNRTLTDLNLDRVVSNTNSKVGIAFELKMAQARENKNDTTKAIEHYQEAAKLLRDKGEFDKAEEIDTKIASLQTRKPQNQLQQPISSFSLTDLELPEVDSINANPEEARSVLDQATLLERNNDYQSALAYYKRYTALQRKLEKDSLAQEAARTEVLLEMDRLKQENEIADLNIAAIQAEKAAEERAKNVLFFGLALIAITAIIVLILYISKRKKHAQLTQAYEDLDQAKEDLQEAKVHISKLLEQQVSPEIASALIEEAPEKRKQFVAIMFLDIRGFTPIAEQMEAKELIEYQNHIFGFMIEIIQKYHGNINQFMGDGFMATFGAPISHGEDVKNAFLAGKEIIAQLEEVNAKGIAPHTKVGIGIHAGQVVTGNVGTETRKQFSVTGNTVIIAARIEQLNKQYGSNMIISQEVNEYLDNSDTKGMNSQNYETHVKGRTEPVEILVFNGEMIVS
ncbi:MAG: adenylate/guanylate cyclase domain-containing protein [Cytophagales bacterium]|nr:adenylate/guanylate cyclase domain-containing protein [Cytophagales bacterium]